MNGLAVAAAPRWATQWGFVLVRYLTLSRRNPSTLLVSAVQPLVYLLLFGPVLTGVANLNGGGPRSVYAVYVPALTVQLALFGGAFTGLTLLSEFRQGVLERMAATPLAPSAMLAGRITRDCTLLTGQAVILLLVALPLGARWSPASALACLGLVPLVGAALSALSYGIASLTLNEGTLSTVFNLVLLPVLLLSGVLLPLTLAPHWLAESARLNPLSYVVNGSRAAFAGSFTGSLVTAYVVGAVLTVTAFIAAVWALRRRP
jgi:ABC-2 type transport system permease protein